MGAVVNGGESHEVQIIVVEHGLSIFQFAMYVNPSDIWDQSKIPIRGGSTKFEIRESETANRK